MNKFNARRIEHDGYTFDSQAEYRRYRELKLLARAGDIRRLQVHPRFKIVDGFVDNTGKRQRPSHYIADFEYLTNDGALVVEDVKGGKATQTALYKLKSKLFRQRYPEINYYIVEA